MGQARPSGLAALPGRDPRAGIELVVTGLASAGLFFALAVPMPGLGIVPCRLPSGYPPVSLGQHPRTSRRRGGHGGRATHVVGSIGYWTVSATATEKARQNPDHAHHSRVLIAYRRRSLEGPAVDRGLQESMPNVVGSRFMLATWPTARGRQGFDVPLSRNLAWYARVCLPLCEGPSHVDRVPRSGDSDRPVPGRSRHLKPSPFDSPSPISGAVQTRLPHRRRPFGPVAVGRRRHLYHIEPVGAGRRRPRLNDARRVTYHFDTPSP